MKVAALKDAIDACNACAESCNTCAAMSQHMRSDDSVDLCFHTAVDCAFVCRIAADSMSCKAPSWSHACQFAVRMSRLTARECRKHLAPHFQNTADACDTCATQCERLAADHRRIPLRRPPVASHPNLSKAHR